MKQIFAILTGLMLVMPSVLSSNAYAGSDRSFTVEFMIGSGGTEGHKGFALRFGKDDLEAHVAHWWGDRTNTAIGVGYVANTEGNGQKGNDEWHASGTVGLSVVFRTNTNPLYADYLHTSHLQPYFRGAVGTDLGSSGSTEIELSYSRYGFTTAEQFAGLGLKFNDRYKEPEPYVGEEKEVPCGGTCGDDGGNDDDDGNSGHGNDEDCFDESNPGNSNGCNR